MDEIISHQKFLRLSKDVHAFLEGRTYFQLHGWELLIFGLRLFLFMLGLVVCAHETAATRILGIVVMAYAYYGIGITGVHEASHNAFVKSHWGNKLWLYFFSDFWSGQSGEWWHYRHVVLHHTHTNVPGKDPPLFIYPWLDKYLYFFVTPFLVSFWLIYHSVEFLIQRKKGLTVYLALLTSGWAFHIALLWTVVSMKWAVLSVFVTRTLFAPIFMHLAVFNHIGLENPESRLPWLPHQTKTTRNLKPHWFLSGMGGNAFVECHVEHHLFPSLSNHMLSTIRPIVQKYLEREGYVYTEESYWGCLKNSLKYYDSLFAVDPITAAGI